jgi:hypothetical protein
MRSVFIAPSYWIQYCKDVFGFDATYTGPDVKANNDYFKGVAIEGENILFANSIEDPWQYASMRKLDETTQSKMTSVLINCNNCAHCKDLSTPGPTDAPPLTAARSLIFKTVKSWLGLPSTKPNEFL